MRSAPAVGPLGLSRLWILASLLLALAGLHCNGSGAAPTPTSGSDASMMGGEVEAGPMPPPVFGGVTSATPVDQVQVALTWDPATGSTAQGSMVYRVYAGTAAGGEDFAHPIATTPSGATGGVIGGLRAATTYFFVVRAIDGHGVEDANTTEKSATTTDTTPPVFAGIQSLTAIDRDKLVVTWNPATDNSGAPCSYHLFYSTTQGGENFTSIGASAPAGSTQLTLTGLSEATQYFVVVRAVDSSGNSDLNVRELTARTLDKTPPVFAGATTATTLGTTITVGWSPATDAVDPQGALVYDVYLTTTSGQEDYTKPTFSTVPGATSYAAVHLEVATNYYFVVRSRDTSKNEDDNTVEVSAKTANSPDVTPPTFAGLTSATGLTDQKIDLVWAAATDDYSAASAITYDVYASSSPGGEDYTSPLWTSPAGVTQYTVAGLEPNQNEYFVVRARDQAGNEDANKVERLGTTLADTVPPTFAGLLPPVPQSPTSILLTWAVGSDDVSASTALYYRIYQGSAPGAESATPIETTPAGATSFVVNNLAPKTTYYFYARVVDEAGNPDTTTPPVEVSSKTPADVTPPTFAGVTQLVSTDPLTLTASWAPATDDVTAPSAIVYRAYISPVSGGELSTTAVTTAPGATTVTFSGLTPATQYYVIVLAVDQAGNVDANDKEAAQSTQADTTPPVFAGASAVSVVSDTSLKVSWLAASDHVTPASAIRYLVCMTPTDGGCNGSSFSATATVTGGLTYTATNLAPGTNYYFVVQSVNQANNDDGNNKEVFGQTAADKTAPNFASNETNLVATSLGDASIKLTWTAATDDVTAQSQIVYDIYQATGSNGELYSKPTYTSAAGATSYTIAQQFPPLLSPSTQYFFVVRARDQAGNEDTNQDEANATTAPDKSPPSFAGATIQTPNSLTQLTLNWTAASDDITAASSLVYQVCWAKDNSCATSFVIDGTAAVGALSYTITGLTAATGYNVLVRAVDQAGNPSTNTALASASTLADTTAPTFAGATGCSNASATSLTVNWNLATDNYSAQSSLRYLVCMTQSKTGCGGAGGAFSANATVTNVTSYQFNSLSPTSTYYFVVRAEDQAGNVDGNYAIVSGQTVVDTTPPTFAGLTGAVPASGNLGDANVTLSWSAASDDVSLPSQIAYDIYQATQSGKEDLTTPTYSAPAGSLTDTVPLLVTGLLPNTTYYFIVRARDAAGNRSATPYVELSVTTNADKIDPTFAAGITGLTAFSDTQLTATWSNTVATDDTTPQSQLVYDVCWNLHGAASPCTTNFVAMATTAANATSYTNAVKALTPSTSYDVVVRAQDLSGNVDTNTVSMTASTSADKTAPVFAGASGVSGATLTSLTVNWPSATDDATATANIVYDVCETTTPGGCTAFTANGATGVSGTSTTFTGLSDNTTYYFVVRARDQAGNEDTNTQQVSGMTSKDTTPPSAGAIKPVGTATVTSLALSWGIATDNYSSQTNISFSIYEGVGGAPSSYTSPIDSGITQTSGSTNTFTVTGLQPSTTYCFVVRATDQAGNQETNTTYACGTTSAIPVPTFTTPAGVSAGYTSLTVSYLATVTPTSGITYKVCYSTSATACPSGGTTVVPTPNTSTSWSLTGLTPSMTGLTYYFLVTATDSSGSTTSSTSGTTTADTTAPSAPTNFTLSPSTSYPGSMTFNWTASTDNVSAANEITYELSNTGESNTYTIVAPGGSSPATTSGYLGQGSPTHGSVLTTNASQTLWVRAEDQAGNWSGWVSATGTTDASYANDIAPVLSNCNGCHSGSVPSEPGPWSYSFWFNPNPVHASSSGDCSTTYYYVTKGSPSASLIYLRMSQSSTTGCPAEQMPLGGPYTNAPIMYNWIVQGANNN